MRLAIQPNIDADIQYGSNAEKTEFGKDLGGDYEALRTIAFDQSISKNGHLQDGKDSRQQQNLGTTVFTTRRKVNRQSS